MPGMKSNAKKLFLQFRRFICGKNIYDGFPRSRFGVGMNINIMQDKILKDKL
jgi:hypothetical protein